MGFVCHTMVWSGSVMPYRGVEWVCGVAEIGIPLCIVLYWRVGRSDISSKFGISYAWKGRRVWYMILTNRWI